MRPVVFTAITVSPVGLMNTCKAQVEEIILNELIWD